MSVPALPTTLSVIVPVGSRHSDLTQLHAEYRAGLEATGLPYEFVFVLDGPRPAAEPALRALVSANPRTKLVTLTRPFGEASIALATAWLHAGQPANAKALLEGEIAKGWDTPELHWVLAGVLEKLGRKADAEASRAAALARNPAAARLYGAP